MRIYLDHNATSPLRPEARAAMMDALGRVGNASSVHAEGRWAREAVEAAREAVAALTGARPSEVVFTSGATEANAWAIGGGRWDTILLSGLEHPSVAGAARASGARLIELPVSRDGLVAVEAIAERVLKGANDLGHALIVLQAANNETGVCQDVAGTAAFAEAHGIAVLTDAVQAAGRVPLGRVSGGCGLVSLSAHKIGGPQGIGALVVRGGVRLTPLIGGGGQERGARAGTENVAAIAGFGAAAAAARRDLGGIARLGGLRDRLEAGVRRLAPDVVVVGERAPRLANTSCLALPGEAAETLVIKLDLAGVAVSAGAACSSGKVGPSAALAAMGLPPHISRAAIRLSLGWSTTEACVATALDRLSTILGSRVARAVA